MAKPAPLAPPAMVALYDKLLATHSEIERKGAKNPYTSRNGHMFSFLDKTGALSLRLGKDEREAFLKKHKTELSFQYNTVMKEYVLVPGPLFKKTRTMAKYLAMSWEYVG